MAVVGCNFYDVLHDLVAVDVNSPFFPLDVLFLSDDVVLEALEDDNFVVSNLVRDEDVLPMCIFIVVLLDFLR